MSHTGKPPLVSAILPFSAPARLNLGRKAVNNFIRQNYTPYELVVVNGTDVDVLTNEAMNTEGMRAQGCNLMEIRVPAGLNAAAMRNHGILAAHGEWVVPIDDDDWCHPERILFQMAHRHGSCPVTLRHQLRVDVSPLLTSPDAEELKFKPLLHLVDSPERGVASTVLFPRQVGVKADGTPWLYDESINTGEHDELIARIAEEEGGVVVANNSHNTFVAGMQWPILSIAVYHGMNELSFDQFFAGMPKPIDRSVVPPGLVKGDIEQLRSVMESYNFRIA